MTSRALFLRCACLVLAAILLSGCSAPPPEHPNVLLITVDTLRVDRISCYGGPQGNTPHIDTLARRGVRFQSVQAPRGLTWPSMTTLLTGLHPRTHHVRRNGNMLAEQFATLPEILQAEGYETGGFLSNMCDAPNRGLEHFFCAWWGEVDQKASRRARQWASHDQPSWDASITRHAEDFIRTQRKHPFFAWVHYIDPHKPYDPVNEYLRDEYDGSFPTDDASLDTRILSQKPLDGRERRQLLAVYDSQVSGVDAHIGHLLATLEEAGLAEKTLVIFAADHGEELGDHNVYFYHLSSVYQQVLSTPLLLCWPGHIPPGLVVDQPIAGVDITPTILDLVHLPALPAMEGVSRQGLALGAPGAHGAQVTYAEWSDQIVVVGEGPWRYIWNPDHHKTGGRPWSSVKGMGFRIEAEELYNLSRDPGQHTNLSEQLPDRAAAMREKACAFVTEKDFRRQDRRSTPEDVRKRLESLGYVQAVEDTSPGPGIAVHCEIGHQD